MIKPILIESRTGCIQFKVDFNRSTAIMIHQRMKHVVSYDIILIDTKAKIVNGDWVINTDNAKNKPNKVSSLDDGTLGVKLTGWFEWRPLSKSYSKIIASTYRFIGFNKSLPQLSPQSIQLLINYYNKFKCMPDSVDIEYIIDEGDKRNWYEDVPSGKYWEDIPVIPSKNNLYTNAEHKICKLNNQGGVDITIPKVEIIGKPVEDYIRAKHTQEECIGFIDGWNAVKEKLYTKEELDMILNNIINDILCKKIGKDLRNNPNSNDISIFIHNYINNKIT